MTPEITPIVRGNGAPVVVVHGGPGLDHSYLTPWFGPLERQYAVHYYDQLGCAGDRQPATSCGLDLEIERLAAYIAKLGKQAPIRVLAHSWGTHLAIAALARSSVQVAGVVLVSPFAMHANSNATIGARLVGSMPPSVVAEYERLAAVPGTPGSTLMNLILPYYLYDRSNPHHVSVDFFRPEINDYVQGSLGNFDMRSTVAAAKYRPMTVFGERDFIVPEDHPELRNKSAVFMVVPRAGHFSFAENSQDFFSATLKYFATA